MIQKKWSELRDDASMTSAGWEGWGSQKCVKNADIYNIASAFMGGGWVNNGQKMANVILE